MDGWWVITTYEFLVRCKYFRSSVLLVQLRRHVIRAMLLKTSLHAIDAAAAHLQPAMDRGRVKARFEQFFDLMLDFRRLFPRAWHLEVMGMRSCCNTRGTTIAVKSWQKNKTWESGQDGVFLRPQPGGITKTQIPSQLLSTRTSCTSKQCHPYGETYSSLQIPQRI